MMCNLGQICVTTDECFFEEPDTGCVDVPAAQQCSACATVEGAFTNMGCPPSWSPNAMYTTGTATTGCTVDCN
jgi:hypothetical protein